MKTLLAIVLALLVQVAYATVPEPVQACQDAVDNFEADPEQALDDAKWCVEQLEQLAQDKKAEQFKDEIAGYKAGQVEQNRVMGMASIITDYRKDGKTIKVTRMQATDQANPLSALAGLAQFGGGRKVRIAGNTGTLMEQNGQVTLNLTLKEGGTLMFESYDATANEVRNFATAFLKEE